MMVCANRYFEIKQPIEWCETCEARRRMLLVVEVWRGGNWTCLTCGERWHADEGRMERPFTPGWRRDSVKRAKRLWERYGRVRVTRTRLDEIFRRT